MNLMLLSLRSIRLSPSIRSTALLLGCLWLSAWCSAAEVNFLVNPSFEDGTGSDAPPWSLWEGSGGAVATPNIGGVQPSPRCWFNTGGSRNLAAANNVNLILDTTGTVPYHVKVRYYVPALASGATKASSMIRMHTDVLAGTTYVVADPILLDDASPEGEVPAGEWVTKDFIWHNTVAGNGYLSFLSFRMYSRTEAGRVNPAPDVYIDECVFASDQYVNDLHGVVTESGAGALADATVTLSNGYGLLATTTTKADGTYSFSQWIPYGAYTVEAKKLNYNPSGPRAITVTSGGSTVPAIGLTKIAGLARIHGTVSNGGIGVDGVAVTVTSTTGAGSAKTVTATTGGVPGSYSIEVPPDTYTVTASQFPLSASALNVVASGDVTLNLALKSVLLVGVYADRLSPGPLSAWPNTGTLGGRFELLGTRTPVAGSKGQYKAVFFDNAPMVLSNASSYVTAPAAITGSGANYTVSAWLFEPDPVLPDQQTYVAWAKRGGPEGSNAEMGYGVNATWGAAGHWGGPDLPWGTPPSGGAWHNVIVTFDGSVESAYIDGVFSKSETKSLNIGTDLPVVLGSGYSWDGTVIAPEIQFSGYMAQVEIFAAPATAEEAARLAGQSPPSLPIATLTGKVVTSDTSAASGFDITVIDNAGVIQAASTTGADGAYNLAVTAPGSYTVKAIQSGYVTMPAPQVRAVVVGETGTLADFTATPSTITGILKDAATGNPIYNGVVQSGGPGGPALVTDATGAFSFPATGCGGAEIFGDALGYHCKNLLVTATGAIVKNLTLTAESETGGLVNGGFENVVAGVPTDWGEAWTAGGLSFMSDPGAASGQYSVWFGSTLPYSALAQYVPLTPGSVYNGYFKSRADPDVTEWFPMLSFRSVIAPDDNELKGWVSGEPGLGGWVHNPPKAWTQYLQFQTYSGDAVQPFVRIAPPPDATHLAASFTYGDVLPPFPQGCYVDDVVIDRVDAHEPLVKVSADNLLPPAFSASGVTLAHGVPSFTFATDQGRQYRVVYVSALSESTWTATGAWTPGTGDPLTTSDPGAVGQPRRFYRLEMK